MRKQLWIEYPGEDYYVMSYGIGTLWQYKSSDDLMKLLNKIKQYKGWLP